MQSPYAYRRLTLGEVFGSEELSQTVNLPLYRRIVKELLGSKRRAVDQTTFLFGLLIGQMKIGEQPSWPCPSDHNIPDHSYHRRCSFREYSLPAAPNYGLLSDEI